MLVLGAVLVLGGVVWLAVDPSRLVTETDEFRRFYLLERLRGYGWLFVAAGAVLAVLGAACRPDADARPRSSPIFSAPTLAVLLAALLVAAAGVSQREWVRFERPCWDHYCAAGRWFAGWVGGEISTDGLLARLRAWPHANSFLGPLVFGTASRVAGIGVVTTYRGVAALSTVGAMVLLHGVLRRLHGERAVVWTAWWLAAAHPAVLRSFSFPQTDAMAMLWVTAILALAFSKDFWSSVARQAAALLLVATALFVKLSLYPVVLLLPLAVALRRRPRGLRDVLATSARGLLYVAVPVGLFAAVCFGLDLQEMLVTELRVRNVELDSTPPVMAEALVKAVFPFASWIALGFGRWGERERVLAAWAGLFLAALLAAEAAGYLRYHVVALPAYAGLAVPGLAVLREQAGERSLAAVAAGMTMISFASLLANTYN